MKFRLKGRFLEAVLISLLSLIGVLSLSSSALLNFMIDYLRENFMRTIFSETLLKNVVLTLLFLALFLWGVKTITFQRNGVLGFSGLLFIFCLSPILTHSLHDWGKVIRQLSHQFSPLYVLALYFQNGLTYTETLLLSFAFISTTLLLKLLVKLNKEAERLLRSQAKRLEVEKVTVQNQILTISTICLAATVALFISSITFNVKPLLSAILKYPWGLTIAGITITCTMLTCTFYFIAKSSN